MHLARRLSSLISQTRDTFFFEVLQDWQRNGAVLFETLSNCFFGIVLTAPIYESFPDIFLGSRQIDYRCQLKTASVDLIKQPVYLGDCPRKTI